jgi:hypothetical protein
MYLRGHEELEVEDDVPERRELRHVLRQARLLARQVARQRAVLQTLSTASDREAHGEAQLRQQQLVAGAQRVARLEGKDGGGGREERSLRGEVVSSLSIGIRIGTLKFNRGYSPAPRSSPASGCARAPSPRARSTSSR